MLALLLLGVRANADYRADFFDRSKAPTITFNKRAMTWTLKNQAVERVIKYDDKAGSLQTVSLRNTQQKREIVPEPGAEGIFSFQAAMMEPPVALTGGKITDQQPADNWAKPNFDAKDWKPLNLPLAKPSEGNTVWLRVEIPEDRMQAGQAYALILERGRLAGIEVYVDGDEALKQPPLQSSTTSLLQIDLEPQNRIVALKVVFPMPEEALRFLGIAEVGSAPQNIDLKSDWKYLTHALNAGEDGSRTLSITLSGKGRHEGFELHVNYQVYAGEEPTLAKWFLFVSHRPTRYLIEAVTYDGWKLPPDAPQPKAEPASAKSRSGFTTKILSPLMMDEVTPEKAYRSVLRPYYRVKPETAILFPKSLVSVYDGPEATGAFLLQLYLGQYVAHGNPTAVPPAFNTRYDSGQSLNAEACIRNIPLASELGLKLFILGDGWQTNSAPDSGTLGDWVTDRSKDRFPQGLLPISLLARQYNMRFGLWTAPALVSEKSQAAKTLFDYLIRRPAGTPAILSDLPNILQMCFTSGWEENYSQSMALLCRELTVSYLHLSGPVYEEVCTTPTHDHPVGHAVAEQVEHWRLFAEKMRKIDPNFLLAYQGADSAGDRAADMTLQDTFRARTMMLQEQEAGAWRREADFMRSRLWVAARTHPSFALTASSPARLPGADKDLDALEYCLTSAAAMVCNLEIHGELDKMTFEERGLVQKWVKWNEENRPWLAFTQPLRSGIPELGELPLSLHSPPKPNGVLHLRNALDGRYGYVCLWNPADTVEKTSVSFRPADYFVRMNLSKVAVLRVKDGKPVAFRADGGTFRLEAELAPHSWEIYEIRVK